MSKTIDTGLSERDLFEAILSSGEMPDYDPAIHLHPREAAKRWRMGEKSALIKLRKDAPALGLEEIEVRMPTGKPSKAFRKRAACPIS